MIQKGVNLSLYALLVMLILVLLLILHLKYYSGLFVVIFAILGIILYSLLNSRSVSDTPTDNTHQSAVPAPVLTLSSSCFLALISVFLFVFSLSLLSLINEFYSKSIGYYLTIAVCAGILMLEIYSYRYKWQGYSILLQTVLLTFNIIFSDHLVFPHGITLPDGGLHFPTFVMAILSTDHISTSTIGYYNIFAFHHVFAAMGILLSGIDPFAIYLGLGSFLVAIGVLFVFILGKRFVSFQFGLITAVLFTCLDYYLMYGEHPEHVAYSSGIALICFTIILYTYKSQKPAFYVLFLVSAIAMVFTHHLTAAIVFIAAGSLVFLDLIIILLTKKFTFPSKFILIVFGLILFSSLTLAKVGNGNVISYTFARFEPYGTSVYSLLTNLVSLPPPVPVTPVPGTITPSLSGIHIVPTQTPGTITSSLSGIHIVPTQTPVPIPTQVTISPTTFDKLSFTELFENTLGSALLVFVSVLGFCSFLRQRSWFGFITVFNLVVFSCLLGLGILFSYEILLPDRLYPLIQIFCLVFLGAMGLMWLSAAIPSKKRTVVIGSICIIVAFMSFFSLTSIINGFETSPFVGATITYPKLYTTGQDVAFNSWQASFLQGGNTKIEQVSINASGVIQTGPTFQNMYLVFDRSLLKTGILISGNTFGQDTFIRIQEKPITDHSVFSSYYDNGLMSMIKVNPVTR
jgi:hypothetical protein